ncbi:MAG TPA: ATP-binding cassette domain-containing protein [Solirubrobacteraceae bacterium]|nr:ATP-binding cassette domain-containing protein [Solirubrobacteraceae bacterium]
MTRLVIGGLQLPLDGEEVVLGSGEDADVRLDGAAAVHATIARADGGWVIAPADDVSIDGAPVPVYGAALRDGATIAIGPHTIVFHAGVPAAPIGVAGRVTLGRAADNDAVLDDPLVAARHAELTRTPEGVRVRDLDTGSGTRVNGQLVSRALLQPGDELAIGPFAWTFEGSRLVPRAADDSLLRAEGVAVRSGGATLLQPTDLVIEEGELVAIVGPSGAGKSTLLHVLAGLRAPTSGRVLIRGHEVTVRQSDLGFVPQDDALHRLLTPREALGFAARLRLAEGAPAAECDAAVERVLAEVDLTAAADRRIDMLSGGQRKRVALAQELISDPAVLLLDEPTSGLDPGLERRLMLLMRRLAAGKRSVVVVTHTVAHLALCDRVAVMAPGGALACLGAPNEVLEALGVATFAELYDRLEEPGERPAAVPAGTSAARPSLRGRALARRRRVLPQTWTLTRRYALVVVRDRRNLRLLAIQAAALSAGAALLFGGDVFAARDGVYLHAGESAQLLFLMVTMAIWFGAISSARQIVAERTVLTRDLATTVRTEAYLLSKGIVLGALAAVQTIVMALIVFTLRPLHGEPGDAQSVVLILVLCAWTGVGFGLVVSAFARSEDQATSYIPLVLLPQLLFGGAVVPTAQLGDIVAAVSHLASAQWGFAAAGHAVDLPARIAGDPVFSQASRYGPDFFSLGTGTAVFVLLVFVAACATVLQAMLRPSFEDTWWQQLRFRLRQRDDNRA